MDLNDVAKQIRSRYDAMSAAREQGLTNSRAAIRSCANSIRAVHRGEMDVARELQKEAREALDTARAAMEPYPQVYFAGFLQDAEKEYAEALATYAIINHEPLPTPEECAVGDAPYLNAAPQPAGHHPPRRHRAGGRAARVDG